MLVEWIGCIAKGVLTVTNKKVTSFVLVALVVGGLLGGAAPVRAEEIPCQCRVSLRYDKPRWQWVDGVLEITPIVDVRIRTSGKGTEAPWEARLAYSGEVELASEDVTPPGKVSFSGEKLIEDGNCSRGRYKFSGMELPTVRLAGVTRELLDDREELEGKVMLLSQITGCGEEEEEEKRQLKFEVEERRGFERVRASGWRMIRD
jgi:hypothetical protein